jgi:hypothetical protein
MRSALGTVAGVLLGLGLLGCQTPVKRPDRIDGRSVAPCPPRQDSNETGTLKPVMRGDAAREAIAARTGAESTYSIENGLAVTRFKYPDGAEGSFSTGGPNGTLYEFRPAK